MKEQRHTIQNAAWLMLQRSGLIVSGLAFAATVPRLMGPENYGRYQLALSIGIWCFLLSEMGLTQLLSRYLPVKALQLNAQDVRKLFNQVLALRMICGSMAALVYMIIVPQLVSPWPPLCIAFMASAIVGWSFSEPTFALFLGLNRAARWGMSFVMRRWLILVYVLFGYSFFGMYGAACGVMATELTIGVVGYRWARDQIDPSLWKPDWKFLRPMLPFGFALFMGSILFSTFRQSGETMIRLLTHDYREVAFYGMSINLFVAAEAGIFQLFTAFTPFLSRKYASGDIVALGHWLERLIRFFSVLMMPIVMAVFLVGERVVPFLFGSEYASTAANLAPLSLAVMSLVPGAAGHVIAVVTERPRLSAWASLVRLLVFWLAGTWLTMKYGSMGACWAVWFGCAGHAGLMIWPLAHTRGFTHRRWLLALVMGFALLAAGLQMIRWVQNPWLVWWAISMTYWVAAVFSGVIHISELRGVMRMFRKEQPQADSLTVA